MWIKKLLKKDIKNHFEDIHKLEFVEVENKILLESGQIVTPIEKDIKAETIIWKEAMGNSKNYSYIKKEDEENNLGNHNIRENGRFGSAVEYDNFD